MKFRTSTDLVGRRRILVADEDLLTQWSGRCFVNEMQPDLTAAELGILRRLARVGGRQTFRPDGASTIAYRLFDEGILSVLLSLEEKGLVRLDPRGTEVAVKPGEPGRFTAITAEITEAGRKAAAL
jgi:hypothetical protein